MITAKFTHPENGSDLARELSRKYLTVGKEYEVVGGEIYTYYSYVYLKGCDKAFNTVQFDFYKDGEPIDIIQEKLHEWNQYVLRPANNPFKHSTHEPAYKEHQPPRKSIRTLKKKSSDTLTDSDKKGEKHMLIATEIQWDFDMDEVYERLDEMKPKEAAESLGVPFDRYERMTTEERHDYAYDAFRHCPAMLDDFMGLPYEIEIPKELTDPEDISDWLSDEYGFCHRGFELKEKTFHPAPKKIRCPSCDKELISLETGKSDGCFNAWCDDCGINISLNPDPETPVSIENDLIRVDWYDAGEGFCGDYNPEDPEDVHLLRFDVYRKEGDDWLEVEDASYCTRMPYASDQELLVYSLYIIFKRYYDVLKDDPYRSVKKLGEELSWICPEDLTTTYRIYYTVETRYATEVNLLNKYKPEDNIDKIKELGAANFSEADFGEAFGIDGWERLIEDEDGNTIWEKH